MSLPDIHLLPGVPLPVIRGDEHPCPYLPGRVSRNVYAIPVNLDSRVYETLMTLGFRRSGPTFYKPLCDGCQACRTIRVPVDGFRASRTQRRVWRQNADLEVICEPLRDDDEHWELFIRYQTAIHGGKMLGDRDEFSNTLAASPMDSFEMQYRLAGRLIGVSVLDLCPASLSSVYFYYDPDHRNRRLGVFSALREIELCRLMGLSAWYVGFWIADCEKMAYKTQFRPYQKLRPDGGWDDVA